MNKSQKGGAAGLLAGLRKLNIPGILIGNIVLFVLFGLANERFLSSYNIMMIFRNTCTLLMAALGFTLVILIGKIDMSVGSVVSMAAVSVVVLYNAGVPVALALLLPLLIGIAVGVINGLLIAKCNFDFWVVTFGMMSVFAGLALVTTDGNTVAIKNDIVNWIGNGKIAGIYVVIWITVILAALMVWIQKKTKFGYDVFALVGSQAVASVSGINVVKTSIIVYALSGLFAALAGVLINLAVLLAADGLMHALFLQDGAYGAGARVLAFCALSVLMAVISPLMSRLRRWTGIVVALLPPFLFIGIICSGAIVDPVLLPAGMGALRFLSPAWYFLRLMAIL